MKVFISQPMSGKTDDEILAEKLIISDEIWKEWPDAEIIDSFIIESAPEKWNDPGRYYILKSLQLLAEADLVVFCQGWEQYRGCRVEHYFAENYGISILEV